MTILVVDDTDVNLRLMEAILKPAGYEVITAYLGRESIEIAADGSIDIILMDISLPDISGTQAMKEIRDTVYGDKPVIAVTAHAMRGDKEKLQSEGFDGYISKPIDIQEMLRMIEDFLG